MWPDNPSNQKFEAEAWGASALNKKGIQILQHKSENTYAGGSK